MVDQSFNRATSEKPSVVGEGLAFQSQLSMFLLLLSHLSLSSASSPLFFLLSSPLSHPPLPSYVLFVSDAPKIDVEQHKFSKATEDSKNTTVGVSVAFEAQQSKKRRRERKGEERREDLMRRGEARKGKRLREKRRDQIIF